MRRWLTRMVICLILGAVTTVAVAWGCAVANPVTWKPGPATPSGPRFGSVIFGEFAWALGDYQRAGVRHIQALAVETTDDLPKFFPPMQEVRLPVWSRTRRPPGADELFRFGLSDMMKSNHECAFGWPILALRYTVYPESIGLRRRCRDDNSYHLEAERVWWSEPNGSVGEFLLARGDGVDWGVMVDAEYGFGSQPYRYVVLPVLPITPGFLIDILVYGALWLALLFGFGATRTARRALRTRRGHCPMCAYDLRGCLDTGCPECGWNRE